MKKFKLDKLREECGVFGVSEHEDASALVALGLHALQHRGQEGCGIVSFDGVNWNTILTPSVPLSLFYDDNTSQIFVGCKNNIGIVIN